jgi:hypothetical protein
MALCQINNNKTVVGSYQNALDILKQKLYNGDYYTSTDSSICVAYNRTIHRYQVFPRKDISISINEYPRNRENFNTIRILDIPTSSDDFDKYIESQIELNKLNNNLSKVPSDYNNEEQENELRKRLIDSMIYLQSSSVNERVCAYFEYDNGNSKIANRCISTLKEKHGEVEALSLGYLEDMLSEQDIPIEIAKELAVIILKERFSVD